MGIEGFSRELEGRLGRGEIGLAAMHDVPVRGDIHAAEVLVEHLYVIGSTDSLEKDSYTLAEALALQLIVPSRQNYLRILVDSQTRPQQAHGTSSPFPET